MIDPGMDFEFAIRLFLGEKGYHTASAERFDKSKRRWLQKVAKIIIKRINELDTTSRHKQRLASEAERFIGNVNNARITAWEIVYVLLRLCGRLLGFDYLKGAIVHTPIYHQNNQQYYTSNVLQGGDVMQDYYDMKDMVSVRKRIIDQLKEDGLTDFKIALVLNTSEYEVKKLRREL